MNIPGEEAAGQAAGEGGAAFQAVMLSIAAPEAQTARRLARLLVESRLAACVQLIDPVRSVYRWRGAIEEQAEVLLLVKSSQEQVPRIGELLRREHPYELPELAAVPIVAGSQDYLSWLQQCLGA